MGINKDKTRATVATILFHLLLLLALIFFALRTPLPLPGEEGVEVNLGYTDQGMGLRPETQQPSTSPPQPQQEEEVVQEEVEDQSVPEEVTEDPIVEDIQEEELITEDTDETPALDNPKEKEDLEELPDETKEEPKEQPEVKKDPVEDKTQQDQAQQEEEVEQVEEKEPEPQVNPRALYTGPTKSEGQGKNEGQTGEAGNQGNPNGTVESENYDGQGGQGSGVSYDLGGRGHKHLPKPAYTSDDQGRVVVTIWVDRLGKVTKAVAGAKGTTVSDLELRNLAKEAALRAKFNPDPNAPEIQKGTITYNFIKLK